MATMHRVSLALIVSCLPACGDKLEDRLAELDTQIELDCGRISDCDIQSDADAVIACLQSNLAARIAAKATFELGLDSVEYVYALDGGYVSLAGFYQLEERDFTEYTCRDVQTVGETCVTGDTVDCEMVRDWD